MIVINRTEFQTDSQVDELVQEISEQRDALLVEVRKLRAAIIWCSTASDFQVDGQARQGWTTECLPLLQPIEAESWGRGFTVIDNDKDLGVHE